MRGHLPLKAPGLDTDEWQESLLADPSLTWFLESEVLLVRAWRRHIGQLASWCYTIFQFHGQWDTIDNTYGLIYPIAQASPAHRVVQNHDETYGHDVIWDRAEKAINIYTVQPGEDVQ